MAPRSDRLSGPSALLGWPTGGGYPARVATQERRCSNCGALVSPDAAWCGQCYAELPEATSDVSSRPVEPPASIGSGPARSSAPSVAPSAAGEGDRADAFWPCRVCGGRNPVDADVCQTCGTSFADVMRSAADRAQVPPTEALVRSLVFPGLGHRLIGRAADGLARSVLFAITLSISLLLGLGGLHSTIAWASFLVFVLAAIAVYALAAFEAYRLASGAPALVSSRQLVWALAVVICVAVAVLTFAVVSGSRR
jgi:ribosomal protein L40E